MPVAPVVAPYGKERSTRRGATDGRTPIPMQRHGIFAPDAAVVLASESGFSD
jgi:hypothetical protein